MPSKKKILVLIQSGYSAKNFILSGFLDTSQFDFTIWYDKDYIEAYQTNSSKLKLPNYSYQGAIDFIKRLKNKAELQYFAKKFRTENYLLYADVSLKKSNFKAKVQTVLIKILSLFLSNSKGIVWLDKPFYRRIRQTDYYKACKAQLIENKPDTVFCTHQRASNAVAPMLAASDLGIKTVCFIHSWDNIPKGVQLVKTDYYFVWSVYMKEELLNHYDFIKETQIFVTGTPQFISYFNKDLFLTKPEFCQLINADAHKRFLLFSGNDKTTSPNDPIYLSHIAEAVRTLNKSKSLNLHILFRPNPIDTNEAFEPILKSNEALITLVQPDWSGTDLTWNTGGPNQKDLMLLINTIKHSELVINMGSTMAVDAAILGKPTCYINYDVTNDYHWSVSKIYRFIHFKMIEDLNPVLWIYSKSAIGSVILKALDDNEITKKDSQKWIERVTTLPIEKTNDRLWEALRAI